MDKNYGLINFYNWSLSNGYDENLTLDRIDNNGPYAPWNCRWATWIEQANNKRNNRILEYNGEKHTIPEWSRITGVNIGAIKNRLKLGWDIEDALTKEVRKMKKKNKSVENPVEVVDDTNLFGEEVLPEDEILGG